MLVAEDGTIIAGHGRLMAAAQLGMAEVPVMVARGWSEEDRRLYTLADNRLAETSEWDPETLQIELDELKGLGVEEDLSMIGFSEEDLKDILPAALLEVTGGLTNPDDVPDADEDQPIAQAGDIWVLGNHRIVCGSSTDASAVEQLLAGAKPHLMVTDPPYGVEYDPGWREQAGVTGGDYAKGKALNDDNADWREAWALFPGDVAYVWHAGLFAGVVGESLIASKFKLRSQIIWDKGQLVLSRGDYHWQHDSNGRASSEAAVSACTGTGEHGMQENLAAGRQIFLLGVLVDVVADAVPAGHEDHCRRRDWGDVRCVVQGAAGQPSVAQTKRARRIFDGGDAGGIEGARRDGEPLRHLCIASMGFRGRVAGRRAALDDSGKGGLVGMPYVDDEVGASRHGARPVRRRAETADADPGVRPWRAAHAVELDHDRSGGKQRVAPHLERGRPRMRVHARDADIQPTQALDRGHDADLIAFRLQNRALLDVELEEAVERHLFRLHVAAPADPVGGIGKPLSAGAFDGVQILVVDQPGEPCRAQQAGREADAFLVGPVHYGERSVRRDARVVERLHRFQRRQNPRDPVEPPAMRLRVEVASGGDRFARRISPGADREHVARTVRAEAQPGVAAPGREERAGLGVLLGEREAAVARLADLADPREFHVPGPEPVCIDAEPLVSDRSAAHSARSFRPDTSCDTMTASTSAPP
jgi:hypothetical protein